jgi:hypothetical protein
MKWTDSIESGGTVGEGVPGCLGRQRRGSRIRLAALAFAVGALACAELPPVSAGPKALTLNTSLEPIPVRYRSIDARDIEFAILLAIAAPAQPPVTSAGQPVSNAVLTKVLGGPPGTRRNGNPWAFASRKRGLIFAEYERGRVWMRVAVKYDDQLVMLRILESRGLGQSDDQIQARALEYLAELDGRIRQTVIQVAQRNRYGTPVPAKLY